MKNKFKIISLLSLSLILTACGGGADKPAEKPAEPAAPTTTEAPANTEAPAETTETTETAQAGEFKAETPILLTSAGQSADVEMIKAMLDAAGISYTQENLATSENLADAKTLILAVGGSSKGLGAAGIDADGEAQRLQELIDAAKANGVKIVALHTGGEARRGELSDRFVTLAFENADYGIAVEDGDKDGLIKSSAEKNGSTVEYIKSITDTTESLKNIFM